VDAGAVMKSAAIDSTYSRHSNREFRDSAVQRIGI
jgi:hypothetical protein